MEEFTVAECPVCGSEVFVSCMKNGAYRCQCFHCYPIAESSDHLLMEYAYPEEAWMAWNQKVCFALFTDRISEC